MDEISNRLKEIKLENLGRKPSQSEDRGVSILSAGDKVIYSPGISTAGFAEIRMAQQDQGREIIATTIDTKGLEFTNDLITRLGLQNQIKTRNEDLRSAWNYPPGSFDVIYARLVLHYLSVQDLDVTLRNFFRSLKSGGKMFIVVQSAKNIDEKDPNFDYDAETHFTSQSKYMADGTFVSVEKRYWHTPESMRVHLSTAGFVTDSVSEYDEQLYHDYARRSENISPKVAHLLEIVVHKPIQK